MKAALAVVALAAAVISCGQGSSPSKATILREFYASSKAATAHLGDDPDTMSFATLVAQANADTASWNDIVSAWKLWRVRASSVLGRLGYGTGGPFTWNYGSRERTALSRFQTDLGIPVTGWLDSLTVARISDALDALRQNDIMLPQLRVDHSSVAGTWKAVTNKLANPVNTVHIEPIVAGFSEGRLKWLVAVTTTEFLTDAMNLVTVSSQTLHVVQWDENLLVARSYEPDAATLTINYAAKEVTWTQELPGILAAQTEDTLHSQRMVLRLVDGSRMGFGFDGGDLRDEHVALFRKKETFRALLDKNTITR